MILRNQCVNLADLGLKSAKWLKICQRLYFSLKLLAFKLSNVRELETIKYAFDGEHSLRSRGVAESKASD